MAIRGIDANLTVGKVAEQSPEASRTARYHEELLNKLAARAHQQETQNTQRTQASLASERRGVDKDGRGSGAAGSSTQDSGSQDVKPSEDSAPRSHEELNLPVGVGPVHTLDIEI